MARRDNLELRGARDRVLDQLKRFGKTAPLRDVGVVRDGLVVPVNTPARVRIDPGQVDVRYMLRERDGSAVGTGHTVGTGGETTLTTPPIDVDVTYKVLARKTKPNEREVYLHDVAPIRVGLDTTIPARITNETPRLSPQGSSDPSDSDPRITDYGTEIHVEVDRTQVGVDYELVTAPDHGSTWIVVSVEPVRGHGGGIVLGTQSVFDDIEIRVRATRTFDPAENRKDQVDLLDVVMPLAVRASRALQVWSSEFIVNHGAGSAVVVNDSQAGVRYQLVARTLHWNDFVYGKDDPPGHTVSIEVPDEPDVLVRRPPLDHDGVIVPPRLVPVGEEQQGTAGDVTFDVPSLHDDTVFVVMATKDHGDTTSVVQLERATAILTRPDPDLTMSLSVVVREERFVDEMRVGGGQPGVLYYFRDGSAGDEGRLPAYFPEPGHDEVGGRGIGRVHIGVDLVVALDAHGLDPVIDLGTRTALPVRFHVQAVKARTRVATSMTDTVDIGVDPTVRLDQADIVTGANARIIVEQSLVGERYQRLVESAPSGNAKNGNGADLVFLTEPLTVDTTMVLQATKPDGETGWAIEKLFALSATVWPKADARVIAPPLNPSSSSDTSARLVDFGATPDVEIVTSDLDVNYRVVDVAGETTSVVSTRPVMGNGSVLKVALTPLRDDAVLRIRVSKTVDSPNGAAVRSFELAPMLPVAVRADTGRRFEVGDGVADYMTDAQLTISESQERTAYQAYTRVLSDEDMFPAPGDSTVTVRRGDETVVVGSPWSNPTNGQVLPDGFTSAGEPQPGTASDLIISIGEHDDDIAVIVTATKDHSGTTSTVVLQQPAAVFVRPDPDVAVELTAHVSSSRVDTVVISGGQQRVLYHLRNGARGVEHDLPAYVHATHDGANRGLDDLRVGVDLIPARGSGADGRTPPLNPMVALSRRPALEATLHMRATRIRTGLSVPLTKTATIHTLPEVGLVDAIVAPGAPAQVLIRAATAGERYELRVDGVSTEHAVVGDGSDLTLTTEPLDTDALLEVVASRPDDSGIRVDRITMIPVQVG